MLHQRSHWIRRSPYGFTLVELLVVISIIGVLISMLLSALSKSREQGRRVSCAANLRQMGIACRVYASDYVDGMPWLVRPHNYTAISVGRLYGDGRSPRVFLKNYANVSMVNFNHHGSIDNRNNIAYCPSAEVFSTGEPRWDRVISYALRGFGAFRADDDGSTASDWGTTRMSALESPFDGAPKVVMMDVTFDPASTSLVNWTAAWQSGNNHARQGANVLVGDGGVRWLGWPDLRREGATSMVMVPRRGYYTQYFAGGTSTGANAGQISVWYPDGTSYGGANHSATNRRMFGYRQ